VGPDRTANQQLADRTMICLSLPCAAADMSAARLLEWLQSECQRPSVLFEALDVECQPPSRTARLESITISHAVIDDLTVRVHYRVEFSEFAPCQDISRRAVFDRRLSGKIEPTQLVFPKPFQPPRRDSVDEF
jgi:hypothetical protein